MRFPLLAAAVVLVALTGCGTDAVNEPVDGVVTADPGNGPANAPAEGVATAPPAASASAEPRTGAELRSETEATGLTSPWGIAVLRDGSVLVSERDTRRIVHLRADGTSDVVATIEEARPEGEAGLLGLAVTDEEDEVLAYYTGEEDNRIVSMSWDGSALGEPELVFSGIPIGDGNRHEGGGMVIGPDGLLYVGTGETGVSPEIAQDRESLGGKVLRITLDGEPAPGNPFDSAVYSLGHRNVEGLAFDDSGRLWASEFGDSDWDELNLIEAGNNYGWPEVEGSSGEPDYVNPVAVWRTADASPAGLTFWRGSLWMAGLRGETLWEIPLSELGSEDAGAADVGSAAEAIDEPVAHLRNDLGRLRNAVPAADGQSLLLLTSNTDSRGEPDDQDDRLVRLTR